MEAWAIKQGGRRGLASPPACHRRPVSGLRGHRKGHAMTNAQYRKLLSDLGLNIVEAGRVLGISPRQAQRYAANDAIPRPVAKLMRLMAEKNIDPEYVETL